MVCKIVCYNKIYVKMLYLYKNYIYKSEYINDHKKYQTNHICKIVI